MGSTFMGCAPINVYDLNNRTGQYLILAGHAVASEDGEPTVSRPLRTDAGAFEPAMQGSKERHGKPSRRAYVFRRRPDITRERHFSVQIQ